MNRRRSITTSIWTARFVPVFIIGIIGYATWVIVGDLSLPLLDQSTIGSAVAVLTLHFLVLIPLLIYYGRLLSSMKDPGYMPRGDDFATGKSPRSSHASSYISNPVNVASTGSVGHDAAGRVLNSMVRRKFFTAESDGLPKWCSVCANWKSERAHHCSDVGRCVRRMDHFCPWYVLFMHKNVGSD